MRFKLITKEQYDELLRLYQTYPKLTFQNKGYEYINPRNLSENELNAIKKIEEILNTYIYGFQKFNNFRLDNNKVRLRFQYNYNHPKNIEGAINISDRTFIGVGYIELDELLNYYNE